MSTEAYPADTTMSQAAHIITQRFDLDAFTDALKAPGTAPVSLRTYEQLPRTSTSADRRLRLYDASSGGCRETPVDTFVHTVNDEPWTVYDKREETHPVGAYKLRVARMAIIESLANGQGPIIDLASAGNFAASAAYTVSKLNVNTVDRARRLSVHAFCRTDTSETKLALLEKYGATVHADYFTLEEALGAAEKQAEANTDHVLIHPFDTPASIAGSVTSTLEYFAQLKKRGVDLRNTPLDLFEPIGGGGKMAAAIIGVRLLQRAKVLGKDIRLIGVEVERSDSAYREIFDQEPLTTESGKPNSLDTDAEGIATLRSGRRTVPVIAKEADMLLSVPKHFVVRACGVLGVQHARVPELAGAMSFAGFLYTAESDADAEGRTPLTTTTGHNISDALLESVCEKSFANSDFATREAIRDIRAVMQARASTKKTHAKKKDVPATTSTATQQQATKKPGKYVPGRAPLNVFGFKRADR